ncbi:MAG TPA: hypothetical protein VMB74_11030 [Streptosporangiaceae bacterium]|nr:hypothetical protein [Streptosporangiaceae bacterium]
MQRLPAIVIAGLVLIAAAGCASSAAPAQRRTAAGPVAKVTGYRSVPTMSSSSAGPVTVRVTGAQASRLALLVRQLPSAPPAHCEEPLGLMYRIGLAAGAVAHSAALVEGYRCGAAVTVAVAGQKASWRRDARCALIRAVRRVLPARAKATRGLSIGCDG